MRFFFSIIEERNCSLYKKGDLLLLTEKTLGCSNGREVCLILCRDMTAMLFTFLQAKADKEAAGEREIYHCSGCRGLIKFTSVDPHRVETMRRGTIDEIHLAVRDKCGKIIDSPFLRVLPPSKISPILDSFKELLLEAGETLILEGKKNQNLYVIVDGKLSVLDGDSRIATLEEGDLCGEMSYLGAEFAAATVKAEKKSRVLAIQGEEFSRLLGDDQMVQSYMARLLVKRLKKANMVRTSNFESSMRGRIEYIAPAELLQIFHMHQKTGVLNLHFSDGDGKVLFSEGAVINASYRNFTKKEAIFKILAQTKGYYTFTAGLAQESVQDFDEIEDFMVLLMEGITRMDEQLELQSNERERAADEGFP